MKSGKDADRGGFEGREDRSCLWRSSLTHEYCFFAAFSSEAAAELVRRWMKEIERESVNGAVEKQPKNGCKNKSKGPLVFCGERAADSGGSSKPKLLLISCSDSPAPTNLARISSGSGLGSASVRFPSAREILGKKEGTGQRQCTAVGDV